jgi:hypothetical protein
MHFAVRRQGLILHVMINLPFSVNTELPQSYSLRHDKVIQQLKFSGMKLNLYSP